MPMFILDLSSGFSPDPLSFSEDVGFFSELCFAASFAFLTLSVYSAIFSLIFAILKYVINYIIILIFI